MLFNKQFNNQR